MKLIKINTDHYVVVDDSEIKEGDWYISPSNGIISDHNGTEVLPDGWNKITHSTQPLGVKPITDKVVIEEDKDGKLLMSAQYVELDMSCTVKPLSLQEVKELIGEVDVEKKAKKDAIEIFGNDFSLASLSHQTQFKRGYNQALEDNNDKKYTEEDVISIVKKSRETGLTAEYLLLSLQPKTEWEVEIVDGKLKLKS